VASRLGPTGRTRFDMADIVRRHRAELEALMHLSGPQRRVLSAMELCRTATLGGHLDVCDGCGYEHPAYNSCRNRHCPKCQALRQEKWIGARSERLLPTKHFHVVFTLPSELRGLAKMYSREVFAALVHAASQTLLDLGHSRLRVTLGITMVLHTWTRKLEFHPHAHGLVTAGGLDVDGAEWRATSQTFLFPVAAMSLVFRAKMLAALGALYAQGAFVRFENFKDPEAFERLMRGVAKKTWIVYAKKPFRELGHVLRYLGRYTHRVAIANSRLVDVTETAVSFRTKEGKITTLGPVEFLRRFLQHVLPDRFHKIRHYGLYAASAVKAQLEVARQQLAPGSAQAVARHSSASVSVSWFEQLRALTGRDVTRCPCCEGELARVPLPRQQAPPLPRLA
jgi:Putative transposase/Transposase zinc-binding domain